MQNQTLTTKYRREIAKRICQYNGKKGTEKQIEKTIRTFPTDKLLLLFSQPRKLA